MDSVKSIPANRCISSGLVLPAGPFLYEFDDNEILARQRQRESNARSYSRRIPLVLKRAMGIYVEDIQGNTFIDCLAGAGSLILGHNHPVIQTAMLNLISNDFPMHTLDLATPTRDEFISDLFDILPKDFAAHAKIQFCGPTGADGVEAALKLVRTATGRNTVLSFHGAYHGMSLGALALGGNHAPKMPFDGLLNGVQFLPFPYEYRCPFALGGESGIQANLSLIESVLTDSESGVLPPAGVIVEVVQGEGGVIPTPPSWLKGLRELTRQAGVPLIVDEVQTGLGRTGELFAIEHSGIIPDVLVLSKAIGGGFPLSVMLYSEELDIWKPGAHAGTFRGNQMAMAAGSAAVHFVLKTQLHHKARQMGARLMKHLRELQTEHLALGDVRGLGLMIGVEVVDPRKRRDRLGHPPGSPCLTAKIQFECLRRGLIIEIGGRNATVIRFLPPLIVGESDIDRIAEIFGSAVKAAVKTQN